MVTTHIICNITHPDTQVAQVSALTAELEAAVLQPDDTLVLAGDFNAVPGSGLHDFLVSGHLGPEHPHARCRDTNIAPICMPDGYRHNLGLHSAYSTVMGTEPDFTNMTGGTAGAFRGTLDYIWHDSRLRPDFVLPLPTAAEASAEGGGLPNSQIPSDHVPLGATFTFC